MRLALSPAARALFRRLPPVNLYSTVELLLLGVLAVQCARLLWMIVTPVGPVGEWRAAEAGVGGASAAILRGVDPFFRVSGAASSGASVTSLQLTLFGTRIDDATGLSSAIIAGPDGVQNSVGLGEEVAPGVRLKAVAFDHVTLDRGGRSEELYIDQSGGATSGVPPVGAPPSPLPGLPIANSGPGVTPAQIRSDVSFTPRIEGGQVTGVIVRPQGSGAGFRAMGFQDGDVITAAGGRAITGQADLDRLVSGLIPGSILSITVERGGQPSAITVTIKGQ